MQAQDEVNESKKSVLNDLNDRFTDKHHDERPSYKVSGVDRWVRILLCRGDLANERFDLPPVSFVQLFRFGSKNDKLLVLISILLGIITGGLQPFAIFFNGKLADVLISYSMHKDKEQLWLDVYPLISLDIVLGIFVVTVTFLQYFCLRIACHNISETLRCQFIQSVLKQDAVWFDKQKFGAINSQLNDGISKIQDGIGDKIGLLVRGLSMFIMTMVMSFITNWKVTLIMIGTGPVCCITMSLMARLINRSTKKVLSSYETTAATLQECIMNVKTVQSCNGQNMMVQRLEEQQNSSRLHAILVYFWNGLFDGIFFFWLYFFYGFGLYYGSLEYYNAQIRAGDVFIIVNAIMISGYYLGLMSPHIMCILKARVAAAIIYEKIDRVPQIDCMSPLGKSISNPRGLVEFKEVSFAYPGRPTHLVLNKVSWRAEPGEMVALVGFSGSGKSTSTSLLTRLYECTDGQICIDGHDVRSLNINQLRKMIGIVQQEPVLFHGTIFENIALGDASISLDDVKQACMLANSHDFIMKLEHQYDTFIGAGNGVALSGGQKQRIAIARAVIGNPPLLLLDEATSALDAESEILVQNELNSVSRGRTTIIIAHRLSTLRNVQKIIVLNKGKVVESGSHDELVANKNGLYTSLVKAQQFQTQQEGGPKTNSTCTDMAVSRRIDMNASFSSTITQSSIRNPTTREYKVDEQSEHNLDRFFSGTLFRLYVNCKGHYLKLAGGTIVSVIRGFEVPFFVILMNMAFSTFQNPNIPLEAYKDRLFWIVVFATGIGVFTMITVFVSISLYGWLTEEVVDAFKVRALRNILRQGAEYFDRPQTSNAKLLQRISNDTTTLKAYSVEIIEQTRTIQLLTKERFFFEKFCEKLQSFKMFQKKIAIYDSITFAFTQNFFFFSDTTCYLLSFYLVYHGWQDTSALFVSSQTMWTLSWAILFVSTSFNEIMHAMPSIDSVFDIITAPTCINDHETDGIVPKVLGDISIEKLFFAYPTRPNINVANGLVFQARRGETIALVGPSGGGKSTVIALIERFYDPKSGQITLDRSPIQRFKLNYLRSQVALVSQEPVLFSGTIFDNIKLGASNVTVEEVYEAARVANAHNFIVNLPQGYETEVGEKGSKLSGGQKQRIAIARALVRNPSVLLLDEATSALDAQSEKIVQQGLDSAGHGRTCIIIAHRLSSIQHADKINFISGGRVVETGTHNELMADGSLYAEMIQKQDLRT